MPLKTSFSILLLYPAYPLSTLGGPPAFSLPIAALSVD
uniref:Uncharacterized protein n=1 Tax=Phakopsora pachyrhizi TaxID=170000 RepID=A0A0S1MK65_PHAPC